MGGCSWMLELEVQRREHAQSEFSRCRGEIEVRDPGYRWYHVLAVFIPVPPARGLVWCLSPLFFSHLQAVLVSGVLETSTLTMDFGDVSIL